MTWDYKPERYLAIQWVDRDFMPLQGFTAPVVASVKPSC
jgi:hypothetical protein